ncbi:hypothetical protein [Enterococcus larvae]|uniref:hypothetical protein n=1 Tax=Enterococcus larvae TaxID=2794352 RepID=UPI003F38D99D
MAIAKIIMNSFYKEVDQFVDEVKEILKEEVHVSSGALQDSITKEKKGEGHYLVGVDAAKLKSDPRNIGRFDYSIPYHDGHKAYTIRPKKAKALRWIGKDGQVRYAKYVRIPASAGDPFVKRAVLRRPKLK